MKRTEKELQNLGGAIINSFIAQHYLKECEHLNAFRHSARRNLTKTLEDLKYIELKYYDEIEKHDENDISDKIVANNLTFIEEFLKFDFTKFSRLQQVFMAFNLDEKRLTGIADKILIENGGEKINKL